MTKNRILRHRITGRVRLTDGQHRTLAAIGKQLGKQALAEVATTVKPDTILVWHRQLVAKKFDESQQCRSPGRPTTDAELEALMVRLAQENCSWGYNRIVGAQAHLGYVVSDQTVGNILKCHGIPPSLDCKKTTSWKKFIGMHMDALVATDFFTTGVWTWCGLVTYDVLFFIRIATREVHTAGLTRHPDKRWMRQIASNVTMAEWGFPVIRTVIDPRQKRKFYPTFQQTIDAAGVKQVPLPERSPNLNGYAGR